MAVTISNLNYKIKIKDEVIDLIKSYRQSNRSDYEAGGMLIGYETTDGNIIIEYATKPFKRDVRKRFSFDRKDKKHNKILKKIWEDEGNIHTYIGEWHTHPEEYPNYSYKDKVNWINIGSKIDKEKLIHIIVGNNGIGIWEYDNKIKKVGDVIYAESSEEME